MSPPPPKDSLNLHLRSRSFQKSLLAQEKKVTLATGLGVVSPFPRGQQLKAQGSIGRAEGTTVPSRPTGSEVRLAFGQEDSSENICNSIQKCVHEVLFL